MLDAEAQSNDFSEGLNIDDDQENSGSNTLQNNHLQVEGFKTEKGEY